MTIQSNIFWMLFLPVTLLLYHSMKDKNKPLILCACSLIFLLFGSALHTVLFLVLCLVNLLIGIGICQSGGQTAKRKGLYISGVVLDTAVLVFYKYTGIFSSYLHLTDTESAAYKMLLFPLGLSFFIFKAISFLTDIYRGKVTVSQDACENSLVYMLFFGQFHSGPISRYSDMALVPAGGRTALLTQGVYRYLVGFCKKTLLADVLSRITSEVFMKSSPDELSAAYVWLGAICWALELYYDFSGYSDMAIGVTNMFGMQVPENFLYPYATASASDFWRRWHASLGAWFRDYVYIPLGGSRTKTRLGTYRNLLAVWLLTGFWHGISLNFIVWGLGHFLLILLEKALGIPKRLHSAAARIFWRIFVLTAVVLLWVIFRCNDLMQGLQFIAVMFGFGAQNPNSVHRVVLMLQDYYAFLIPALLFTVPVIPMLQKKCEASQKLNAAWNVLCPVCVIAMFLLSITLLVYGGNNPFVYAAF